MAISRRNLRKGLVVAGCLFGQFAMAPSATGLVLILAGAVLHWLSKAYLEQNRELTTAGPYRWTRNPFYVANFLIDAGIVCVIGRFWVGLIYFPLWGFAYWATIRSEEERLRELFGARFDAYVAAVPRFFPVRRPLDPSLARGRFDLGNPSLVQGREYARLLGIALAPVSIWAAEIVRTLKLEILAEGNGLALGLVLIVPALWILKLGLAETLRAPEVSLLPSAGSERSRAVWALIVAAPLLYAAFSQIVARQDGYALASVGLLGVVVALALIGAEPRRRIVGEGTLALCALALGLVTTELWLALVPALWFALAALDEVGRLRCGSGDEGGPRPRLWRYFPRIAAGAIVGLLVMGGARVWLV